MLPHCRRGKGDSQRRGFASSERIYEGEPVALSVSITTTNPDIAYIELMSREDFQGFTILNVPTADAGDGHLTRIQKTGKRLIRL